MPFLIQHHFELLLDRHAAEQGIHGLAARDAVVVAIRATVGDGLQVFDAGVVAKQRLFAEEAEAALDEQQAVEWSGRHGRFRLCAVDYPGIVAHSRRATRRACCACPTATVRPVAGLQPW